jgi:hypothetical protein
MPHLNLRPARPTHELATVGAVLLLYLLYLPFSGYSQLYYDSQTFWDLATRFITPERRFSLLHYSMGGRGYVWPLVLVPLRAAWVVLGGQPISYTRVLGAAEAALVFGWLGPRLWQALSRSPALPSLGRRAAFVLLGFACWRDHFNFPLTDFPALLLIGAVMLAVLQPRLSLGRALLLGAALGLAFNIRPIYQLSAVALGLAALWPAAGDLSPGRSMVLKAGAVLAGLALVLAPQYLMFRRHYPTESPWHLAGHIHQEELVRKHLIMGLETLKYETNVGADYPEVRMWYINPIGQAILQREHIAYITDESQYWQLLPRYPLQFAGLYLRRVFDGLDIQYPTLYVRQVYQATWGLALLNYCGLLLGLSRLVAAWRAGGRLDGRRWLVAAALLLPCLGSLPMAVESRFLLTLHFIISAAATLGWPATWTPARLRAAPGRATLLGLAGALLACFTLSAHTQGQLEHGGRRLDGRRGPAVPPPAPRVNPSQPAAS